MENKAEVIKPEKYVRPSTYGAFLKRQERILKEDFLCNQRAEQEGIVCTLPDEENCYYVALIHPDKINLKASKLSKAVAAVVPAVEYNSGSLHTTLANGYITNGFFLPEERIIGELKNIIRKIPKEKLTPLVYHAVYMGKGAVIAAAYGNEGFFDVALAINKLAKKSGLDLNFPWGAHMSINRFSEARKPGQMRSLITLINKAEPIGQSMPVGISVGTAFTTKTDFKLIEYDRIAI